MLTIGQSNEMQTKQNYQFLSVMIANDKLIGLGIIKLKDTDLFLDLHHHLLPDLSEFMYIFKAIYFSTYVDYSYSKIN